MGRHKISMAIRFRLENTRRRGKVNYLMLSKGSGVLHPACTTRKVNYRGNRWWPNEKWLHCPYIFLHRRMKQSQKTAYLMYQAMKVHESSWHMPQQKGFGCLWEKKSKLCSVRLKIFQVSLEPPYSHVFIPGESTVSGGEMPRARWHGIILM